MTQSTASTFTASSYSREDTKTPSATHPNALLGPPPPLPIPVPSPITSPNSHPHSRSRTGSRSPSGQGQHRRRLTVGSLGAILMAKLSGDGSNSSNSASGSDDADPVPPTPPQFTPTHSTRASIDEAPLSAPRSVPHLTRSGTANNSSVTLPPSPSSPPFTSSSPPPSPPKFTPNTKPPVSLPNFLRRRLSSSAESATPPPPPASLAAPTPAFIRRTSSQERLSNWAARTGIFNLASKGRRNSTATPPTPPPTDAVPSRARAMSEEIPRPAFGIGSINYGLNEGIRRPQTSANGSGLGREEGARRRASSYAPATEITTSSGDEELDLYAFAAQGASPSLPSSAFSSVSIHRVRPPPPPPTSLSPVLSSPALPTFHTPSFAAPESPPISPRPSPSPTSSSPSPHRYPRTQTRNIDSLHLVDFERISPPLSMHASPDEPVGTASSSSARVVAPPRDPTPGLSPPPLVPTTSTSPPAVVPPPPTPATVVVASSSSPPVASSSASPSASETATARRLRGLPRLLSSEGYGFPTLAALRRNSTVPPSSPPEEGEEEEQEADDEPETEQEETETEETETELETDTDDDSDDGDADGRPGYSSADEGHPPTPGPAPAPATASTPRLGFGGTPSPFIAQSTSSWVTFNPFTPTPGAGGPLQTARITDDAAGGGAGQSYFDLPRGSTSSSATATLAAGSKTPRMSMSGGGGGGGMMSPLLPMSMSSAARGKRPTRQDEVEGESTEGTTTMEPALGSTIYRRRSHSVVNVMSPGLGSLHDNDAVHDPASSSSSHATNPTIPTEQETLDPIWRSNVPSSTPLSPPPAFLSPSLPNAPLLSPSLRPPHPPKLGRPRSMYELHVAPPAYHSVYIRPGLQAGQIVFPREEEGREPLPSYTCAVHYESYMPRKMEFVAPTVQAKDRAWKRQYIVLHGTAIKVYKYDLRTHPIPGEEDWSEVDTSMAGSDGPPPLHFHVGEYGSSTPSTPSANNSTSHPPHHPSSKFPSSIIDARALAKSRLAAAAAAAAATTTGHHGHNVLLRHYSLQNAESGLAADYIKRKHAVRVRAEGEQFLLQAKDDRGVIDLIEALQAATNVALDLDTRLPPKFITLPRRRRRRRRPEGDAAAGSTGPTSENAVPPSADDSQLGDMLAEEQTAYAARSGATVM